MVKPNITTALAAACFMITVAHASGEEVDDRDRFELWNDCEPVAFLVTLNEDTEGIGLARDDIEIAVRSRLRAARLYDGGRSGLVLHVKIGTDERFFIFFLRVVKRLYDPISDTLESATTWLNYSYGVHGDDADALLFGVTKEVDEFIDEYLRVNAAACGGPEISK